MLKNNTVSDFYITRFSTIKFFNPEDKNIVKGKKAGGDKINIEFPDFIREKPMTMPTDALKFNT